MLKIKNKEKVIGHTFVNDRFVCKSVHDDDVSSIRFQFEDLGAPTKSFTWIEMSKHKEWDNHDKDWYYRLRYRNAPEHRVTLDYFNHIQNVLSTFEDALKTTIK